MYHNRTTYRKHHHKKDLVSFDITVKETNLNIQAQENLSEKAVKSVLACRNTIENYISIFPDFATSLVPISPSDTAPEIIQQMIQAGRLSNTGPMASVAGTVAQFAGTALLSDSQEVVVENGGDIFIKVDSDTIFAVYAENSPLSMTCGILVKKRPIPYGICTSSGTLGHSTSFGKADAVTVISNSCAIADAAATGLANQVQSAADISKTIDKGKTISGIDGIVIIKGSHIGLWGDLEIVPLS